MRCNTVGDYCAGITKISRNKVFLGKGGGTRWLTDGDLLANCDILGNDHYELTLFSGPDWQPKGQGIPVTRIGSGGGNYAATLESQPTNKTVGEFNGSPLSADYINFHVIDGFRDGSLLFATPDWRFIHILWEDGATDNYLLDSLILVSSIRLIEGGYCYSTTRGECFYMLRGEQAPHKVYTVDTPFSPYIFKFNNEWWVLYHNTYTYLHPVGSLSGYKFIPMDNIDIWVDSHGMGKVVGALDPGEESQGVFAVDLHSPRELLEEPIDVSIPPFTKFHYEGPFFATGQYGNADTAGNCEVLIRTTYGQMVKKRPVVCDVQSSYSVPDGQLIGIFYGFEGANTDSIDDYQNALARAKARNVPLFLYWDAPYYPKEILDRFANEPNIIPTYQCYPQKIDGVLEPLNECIARFRRNIVYLTSRYPRVAISHSMYTQTGNFPLRHVLSLQQPIGHLIEEFNIYADFWFAWLRDPANSIAGNPQLIVAANNFEKAVVNNNVPPIILPSPDSPPTVYFINPTQGQTYSGTLPVLIAAEDDKGIRDIELFLDGNRVGSSSQSPYLVNLDTTVMDNGRHLLQALAIDTAGNASRTGIYIYTKNVVNPPVTDYIPKGRNLESHMKGYLKYGPGTKVYIGVDPSNTGVVYHDREAGGSWEEVELFKLNDRGDFSVKFTASNKYLSQNPKGGFETRDAVGAWETFFAVASPVGSGRGYNLVFRFEYDFVLFPVLEFVEKH